MFHNEKVSFLMLWLIETSTHELRDAGPSPVSLSYSSERANSSKEYSESSGSECWLLGGGLFGISLDCSSESGSIFTCRMITVFTQSIHTDRP